MRRRRNGAPAAALGGLLLPVLALAVLLGFASAVSNLDGGRADEDLRRLEDALRRGCVACYAAEGVYPPNLEYLEDRYGVQVDDTRYVVYYDIFAENLMPDLTVLELEP